MIYEDLSRWLVSAASILLVFGLYHQVFKMFRTQSAADFSWGMLIALVIAEVAWLNYGLVLEEWPILFLAAAELPAGIMAIYGRMKFAN